MFARKALRGWVDLAKVVEAAVTQQADVAEFDVQRLFRWARRTFFAEHREHLRENGCRDCVGRRAAVTAALPEVTACLVGHGATRVWLFGSFGWSQPSTESDVDLAVQGLPTAAHFRAWDAVDDLLARHGAPAADLVRFEDAPPGLQSRILAAALELHAT